MPRRRDPPGSRLSFTPVHTTPSVTSTRPLERIVFRNIDTNGKVSESIKNVAPKHHLPERSHGFDDLSADFDGFTFDSGPSLPSEKLKADRNHQVSSIDLKKSIS
jgi:hypothetical protein